MAEQRVPRFLTKPSLGTLWVHLALATVSCHRWDSGGSWQEEDPREQGFLVFKFLVFLFLLKPSQPKWATGCEASCGCPCRPSRGQGSESFWGVTWVLVREASHHMLRGSHNC